MFAQLFLEERKVLYTLSEQFIPLVVPLQKPDQLNQLLWLKTAHPACQEAGRTFFPVLFTNSKTEFFSAGSAIPYSQYSTIYGNIEENLYMLSKEKVYFFFSWFFISVLIQYIRVYSQDKFPWFEDHLKS